MSTVLDLLTDGLTTVGELGQGETLAPEDSAYCLSRLNSMLDSWSTERLYVPFVATARYPLIASKGNYTIGQTGTTDIAAPRPIAIEDAAILLQVGSGFTRHPLTIISQQEYALIADQGAIGNTPEKLWCDFNYPNAAIIIWPTPTCPVATQLELVTWSPVSQFSTVNATVTLPPGYYSAILWNLCVEIMPGYDLAPNPTIQMRADEGKRRVAGLNMQQLPPAVREQVASGFQAAAQQQQPPQQ